MTHSLKEGDKVVVKKNLRIDTGYPEMTFVSGMVHLKGRTVTIENRIVGSKECYHIVEDSSNYGWSLDMFEPIKITNWRDEI